MCFSSEASKPEGPEILVNQKFLKYGKTRLESKVYSFERLYPSFLVEVSKSLTNIGFQKYLGLKKLVVKKILGMKQKLDFFWSNNFCIPIRLWVQIIFGLKNFCLKNILVRKHFGSKKNLGLKSLVHKNQGQKKMGPLQLRYCWYGQMLQGYMSDFPSYEKKLHKTAL